jgi:hypothetical protein
MAMTLTPKETDGAPPAPAATGPGHPHATPHRLARRALFSFLLTFVLSRTVVVLIMSDHMPNLYFFLQGTHVHHLNYGIFLLSAVAGYAIFRRPVGRAADRTALVYGVALGLTFDEFGLWLHLGGSYWQRASIDATIVVAALIGLIAFARSLHRFEARHFWSFLVLAVLTIGFAAVLILAGGRIGDLVGPKLHALENASSP